MAASHNSFPTPQDVQQELLWQHQLSTSSFPRQAYERYKALKFYMWNTLMNWNWWWKKAPPPVEEQVMLPPGDSHFIATQIFLGGQVRRKVILHISVEGIEVINPQNEDEKQVWSWDAVGEIQFNFFSNCLWWLSKEEGTNITFEELNAHAVHKKVVESIQKHRVEKKNQSDLSDK